jgi:2-hydroxychromene-2-carboxylate isomerase
MIKFFFDFVSPFSYLLFKQLKRGDFNIPIESVQFYPIVLSSLFQQLGHKGPGSIPAKALYLFQEAQILAKKNDIELNCPNSLPINSVFALRIVSSLDLQNLNYILVMERLFDLCWKFKKDIGNIEVLLDDPLLSQYQSLWQSPDSKKVLRANLKLALDLGVFGVPSLVKDFQVYWGSEAPQNIILNEKIQLSDEEKCQYSIFKEKLKNVSF